MFKIEHLSDPKMVPFFYCWSCGESGEDPIILGKGFFEIIFDGNGSFAPRNFFICSSCVHRLHLAIAPLQILVTTGKDTKPNE